MGLFRKSLKTPRRDIDSWCSLKMDQGEPPTPTPTMLAPDSSFLGMRLGRAFVDKTLVGMGVADEKLLRPLTLA